VDLSPFIAYGAPVLGVVLSLWFGLRCATSTALSTVLAALALAVLMGFILMFGQIALHSLCIARKLCDSRGDANMGYWFQSFFAIPLYWLTVWTAWRLRR
jgi:hypothetical protein